MIPFSSSLLCVPQAGNPFHGLCIIEPAGVILETNDDERPHNWIRVVKPVAQDGGGILVEESATNGSNNSGGSNEQGNSNIFSAEWILLETLDYRLNRPLNAGPLLMVQRWRLRRKSFQGCHTHCIANLRVPPTNFSLARINHCKWFHS